MEAVETTGKSLQEAKQAAAAQLGVDPGALEVTVLEETKGLFGKTNVRIRATAASSAPSAPPAAEEKAEPKKEKAEAKGRSRGRGKKEAPVEAEAAPEEPEEAAEAVPAEAEPEDAAVEATQEDADRLLKIVQDILRSGDLNATANVSGISSRYVNIELDGRDVAFIVGKHGEVLNALQYLVNIIANQHFGNGVRVTLDGNDYRRRREEKLEQLATKIAEQVRGRGEEAVLDALPAFERRIVHKALANYEGITTYSEGEEPNRRVVIAPMD